MKKGVVVLLVGIILLVSAIGIFAYSGSYIGENVKNITLNGNETKSIEYDLKAGNYAFVLSSSGKISYIFENSTGVVKEEKNITQATVLLDNLEGKYTLKITNMENETVTVSVVLKEQTSLTNLGMWVLASGGICLVGIIVIIVGIVLLVKERKKGE
ncbi:hypothetical protein B6U71_04425 [Euryarchaeota archaeon ex4484_178]|nr:MAG: hypothetical protein B6U71_04425 [Euryarchaeota archaeon ex4484_178]